LEQLTAGRSVGTIVLWHRIAGYRGIAAADRRTQRQFYDEAEKVRSHLGLVFARFLTGSAALTLRVTSLPVEPWDPFLSSHPSVMHHPVENLPLEGHKVRVEPFILPGLQRLTPAEAERAGGPKGWLRQQGFYVYRRNRLILAGSWLGIRGLRREERYNLARIAVDIPAETDAQWQVDVRKATVVPPVALRQHLQRIARTVRSAAAETVRNRGQIAARQRAENLSFAWSVRRDENTVHCRINRKHPMIQAVLREGGGDPANIRALLRLLEETVPVPALRVLHETDTADDPEPFGGPGKATEEATKVAQCMFDVLVTQGRSPDEARQVIRTMQPFDQLNGFWNK
jgi:hypothetical protein